MSIKLGISVLAAAVLLLSACTTRSGPPLPAPGPAPHGGPLAAGEQLYTKKTASFSDHWAVQHDCPLDVAIVFSARVGQAVVSVSGSPGMAECRDGVQEARRLVRSVAVAELSPGDQFCGVAAGTGHVFLMAVTEATTTEPVEVTWEVTAWAGPAPAQAPAKPGVMLYEKKPFEVGDQPECVPGSVDFGTPDGPVVGYGDHATTGDLVYLPPCLGGSGEVRLGGSATVDGGIEVDECLVRATGSTGPPLDVEVPDLRAGYQFCVYDTDVDAVTCALARSPGSALSGRPGCGSARPWRVRLGPRPSCAAR